MSGRPDGVPLGALRDDGPQVERAIAIDVARRAVPVLGAVVGAWWLVGGSRAALSAGIAGVLVLGNLVVAAVSLGWAARVSLAVLMGTALFGFLVRFGVVAAAMFTLARLSTIEVVPLGVTLIGLHLGLLFWEIRFVSATLAYPGLRPSPLSAFSTLGTAGAKE